MGNHAASFNSWISWSYKFAGLAFLILYYWKGEEEEGDYSVHQYNYSLKNTSLAADFIGSLQQPAIW